MKIENLMSRDARTCRPEDRLVEPARVMWENDCGCVPVVDAQLHVVGMITDRDICMAAYTRGERLADMTVETTMSRSVHYCRRDHDVKQAEELMKREQLHRLPVLDDADRLVGLLSINDLACAASSGRAAPDQRVTPEEVGLTLGSICAHRKEIGEVAARPVAKRSSAGAIAPVPI